MKKHKILLTLSVTVVLLISIGATINAGIPSNSQSSLVIMTTIAPAYDVVKSIAGQDADIESIVDSATDIHAFDGPTASQLNKMVNDADVIFALGIPDSEPWLQPIIEDNPTLISKIVNLSDISVDGIPDPLLENEINPHIWMDPNIVKKFANITTTTLISLDASNSALFEAANSTYQAKLDTLLASIDGNRTAYFDGMKIVENHPAFMYLLNLLGIERIAVIETHEHGSEPDPQHIDEIIELITSQSENVTIISNPQHSSDHTIEIAQATNSKIAIMSPFPGKFQNQGGKLKYTFEVPDYISMIEYCMYALRNPVDPPKAIPGYSLVVIGLSVIIGIGISFYFHQKHRS